MVELVLKQPDMLTRKYRGKIRISYNPDEVTVGTVHFNLVLGQNGKDTNGKVR